MACGSLAPETPNRFSVPSSGAVASAHELATRAGIDVLDDGGNAADAAVAAALVLAVVHPHAGPLGGGGLALWVAGDPNLEPRVLDFRAAPPAALESALSLGEGERASGSGLAVGAPGGWIGLYDFQRAFGRVPFAAVARRSIELARDGVPVSPVLARELAREQHRLAGDPGVRARFYPGGTALAEGVLLRQESLARFLEQLARRGPRRVLETSLGDALSSVVQRKGGVLERRDLESYRPEWRAAMRGWFRGLEVVTVRAPGGLVLLETLLILDGLPLDAEIARSILSAAEMGQALPEEMKGVSARGVHWWLEAFRLAFEDATSVLLDGELAEADIEALLTPEHIVERRVSIGEFAHSSNTSAERSPASGAGESAIVALDRDGNAVSLVFGLEQSFGSGIYAGETGFFLNAALEFLVGDEAARSAPELSLGRRPLTWLTPAIVREGGSSATCVLGGSGGAPAAGSLVQAFLRSEVYTHALEIALSAPRFRLAPERATSEFEPGWDPVILRGLEGRQHGIVSSDERLGVVQAIRTRPGGTPEGAVDPRQGGSSALQVVATRRR